MPRKRTALSHSQIGTKVFTVLMLALSGTQVRGGDSSPLRPPLRVDQDNHSIAQPQPFEVSEIYGLAYNSWLRHFDLERKFVNHSALNVNAWDEVPDSSWFTNRLGKAPLSFEDIVQGLEGKAPRPGPWKVARINGKGYTPKLDILDSNGEHYVLKFDLPGAPERNSAAERISTLILHAAGYNVPHVTGILVGPRIDRSIHEPGLPVVIEGRAVGRTIIALVDQWRRSLEPVIVSSRVAKKGVGVVKIAGVDGERDRHQITHRALIEIVEEESDWRGDAVPVSVVFELEVGTGRGAVVPDDVVVKVGTLNVRQQVEPGSPSTVGRVPRDRIAGQKAGTHILDVDAAARVKPWRRAPPASSSEEQPEEWACPLLDPRPSVNDREPSAERRETRSR